MKRELGKYEYFALSALMAIFALEMEDRLHVITSSVISVVSLGLALIIYEIEQTEKDISNDE